MTSPPSASSCARSLSRPLGAEPDGEIPIRSDLPAERTEVPGEVDLGDPLVLRQRQSQSADRRLALRGELLERALSRRRRFELRAPVCRSHVDGRHQLGDRLAPDRLADVSLPPTHGLDERQLLQLELLGGEGGHRAAEEGTEQPHALHAALLREDRYRVAHVLEPGRHVDLTGRAVRRMEILTNSEGREPCGGEPAGQKRLEPSEVAVLGADRRRDHPPGGPRLGEGRREQRERAAGSDPALDELLGDPGSRVLVTAKPSHALEVDRHAPSSRAAPDEPLAR